MAELSRILEHIGFEPRPQQIALFQALCFTDETGTVAQAGTGTGKSLAVLAAAAHWRDKTGIPTLIVVPTNILLDQYLTVDAPRVGEALGLTIKSLKGRNHYLCQSAPGFAGLTRLPDEVISEEVAMNERLHEDEIFEPENTYWFGCPGSEECDRELICHYRRAKSELGDADIIITNAHLLIIDDQLKGKTPIEVKLENDETVMWQPAIFPEYGALFVDECHTLEDNLRSFATRSIPQGAVVGVHMYNWLHRQNQRHEHPARIDPDADLVKELTDLAFRPLIEPETGIKLKKHERQAVEAAKYILQRGRDGAYKENEAVLWLEPARPPFKPKLVSTQINLAGGARRLLTKVPFGLVSGTVPKSLRGALGIPDAHFLDVGHPFDYSKQVTLKISSTSGSFQAVKKDAYNMAKRADELAAALAESKGGALCLFASYRDMEWTYQRLLDIDTGLGLDMRIQTREGDKKVLGQWFKDHGNAVLFATESFATGFDVPGDALRLVSIWKLPYPGLDPVTKAIMARSRQRYEDMMLMKCAQAAGRLIRTSTDTGTILILDSRAEDKLLGSDDPMIAHFDEMARPASTRRARGYDID